MTAADAAARSSAPASAAASQARAVVRSAGLGLTVAGASVVRAGAKAALPTATKGTSTWAVTRVTATGACVPRGPSAGGRAPVAPATRSADRAARRGANPAATGAETGAGGLAGATGGRAKERTGATGS
jgi:hypothetical protein